MSSNRSKIKDDLASRQQAYQQTFLPDNQAAKKVLYDLALFCRANASTFNSDSRIHAVLEGRREVWLRIQKALELNPVEFLKLYLGKDENNE
jgi:hypothetical protein